MPDAR